MFGYQIQMPLKITKTLQLIKEKTTDSGRQFEELIGLYLQSSMKILHC